MNENQSTSLLSRRVDPYSIGKDILRNLWAVALLALAAAMLMNVYARLNHQTSYSTTARFIVKSRTSSNYSYSNLTTASSVATSFSGILNSSLLKKKVCEDLKMDTFDASAKASVVEGTNLLTLEVTADSPKKAYQIMASIMKTMNELSQYVSSSMVMDVLLPPQVPTGADAGFTGYGQSKKAFIIAFGAGILLFGFLSYLKDTIKGQEDLEDKLDAKCLGTLYFQSPYKTLKDALKKNKDNQLITGVRANFEYVERFKKLTSNISGHMKRHEYKTILVTSVSEHEGKSTVAANLALSLAQQGKAVLLIDGDMRRPSQKDFFIEKDVRLEHTLADLLERRSTVKETIYHDKKQKLYMMLNNHGVSNSTDLVASVRMKQLVDAAKVRFDYIVIDSPPMALMADAESLAEIADLSILVVKYDHVTAGDINDAIDTLNGCHAEFYGCVLNEMKALPGSTRTVGGYGTYGRYGRYGHYGRYGRYGSYGSYGAYSHYEKATEEKA